MVVSGQTKLLPRLLINILIINHFNFTALFVCIFAAPIKQIKEAEISIDQPLYYSLDIKVTGTAGGSAGILQYLWDGKPVKRAPSLYWWSSGT